MYVLYYKQENYATKNLLCRIEIRLCDGSTNPYLGLAAILAAGLHGVKNQTRKLLLKLYCLKIYVLKIRKSKIIKQIARQS